MTLGTFLIWLYVANVFFGFVFSVCLGFLNGCYKEWDSSIFHLLWAAMFAIIPFGWVAEARFWRNETDAD